MLYSLIGASSRATPTLIHSSAWKVNSANFALTAFSVIRAPSGEVDRGLRGLSAFRSVSHCYFSTGVLCASAKSSISCKGASKRE
jgi:hypothetical protein